SPNPLSFPTRRSSDLVILCYNVLEYVDDPNTVLRGAARLLRTSSAIISVLVRNQAGEVLKAALQSGDLAAAEHNLTADWGEESRSEEHTSELQSLRHL